MAVAAGGVWTLVMGVLGLGGADIRATRARIREARAVPSGPEVLFDGTFVGGEVGPLSGKPVAWFELIVEEDHGASEPDWRELLRRSSSDRVALRTELGTIVVREHEVHHELRSRTDSGPVVEAPETLERWLVVNGLERSSDGFKRRRRYAEIRIEAGTRAHGVGRLAGKREREPYRGGHVEIEDPRVHRRTPDAYLRSTLGSTIAGGVTTLATGVMMMAGAVVLTYIAFFWLAPLVD
jgi:hypothetical protein